MLGLVSLSVLAHESVIPTGGLVVFGDAQIESSERTVIIRQRSEKAITEWSSFDICAECQVRVLHPTPHAVTLIRVITDRSIVIDGKLEAMGKLIIVNVPRETPMRAVRGTEK